MCLFVTPWVLLSVIYVQPAHVQCIPDLLDTPNPLARFFTHQTSPHLSEISITQPETTRILPLESREIRQNKSTCGCSDVIVRKVRRIAHRSVPPLPSETYKAIVPQSEDSPACSDDSCQLQAFTKRWLLSVYNYCPPGSC
ncbi:hypothetical protein Zmor_013220 [Zophobas morio]|uniref:Uncharacterized protein n=1 Tax=Zophobas morio TaxID=2755281 RepID=A0AA38MEG6_9CUCU|nr:hypothetical protein Zmor_013220 [Zophobas morio]